MTKFPLKKLVEVEWEDSCSTSGWASASEFRFPATAICRSVGYVFRSDKREILLMQNQGESGNTGMSMAIPRKCIKRVRILKSNL